MSAVAVRPTGATGMVSGDDVVVGGVAHGVVASALYVYSVSGARPVS